jgi:hypothetical protein
MTATWRRRITLAAVLVAFSVIESTVHMESVTRIGADEGFELAKATLVSKGHQFYSEVWNDQPPLHTLIVVALQKVFPHSLTAARMVSVVSAAALLCALIAIAGRITGPPSAGITAAFLLFSPAFVELSSSCMVEIPDLMPVVAALAVLVTMRRSIGVPLLAGVLFAIGLQIKFIGLVFVPLLAFALWLRGAGEPAKGRLIHAAAFLLSSILAFSVIAILTGGDAYILQLKQSWFAHFAPTKSYEYGSPADHPFDWTIFLKHWDASILAVIGIIFCLRRARKSLWHILPVLWLILEIIVFSIHRPWWSYYYIHIAVPLSWCAAIGLVELWTALRNRSPKTAPSKRSQTSSLPPLSATIPLAVFLLAASAWMTARVYLQIRDIRRSPQLYYSIVLPEIARYKPFTEYIFTDEPVYSFHADIPMPPRLAIVSLKRLWSADLTNASLTDELYRVKPGLMLLRTDTGELPFQQLLTSDYQVVFEDDARRLYVRKDIVPRVPL